MYWFLHSMNWNSWGSVLSCVLGTVALVYLFERWVMNIQEKEALTFLWAIHCLHYSMFRISPSSYEVIDDEAEVCRKM